MYLSISGGKQEMKLENEVTLQTLSFGVAVFIISAILVNAGVHIDYVGMGVALLFASLIIFVNTTYFHQWLDQRELIKQKNRSIIENE